MKPKFTKVMSQLRKPTFVLSVLACFLILSDRSAVLSQGNPGSIKTQTQPVRRGLSPEEKRGKAFYLRGESSSGQQITALMGEIEVPATTLTCSGCHGARGEGKTEGGVTAGNISWSDLTKPYGHAHESGRRHPAFSEASFVRTVTAGIDPAGNKLSVAMPTYRMPLQDMSDLLAYLKRIEADFDPGVSETSIVIGTLLPDKSALTGLAEAMGNVLQAYFAEINSNGGIYNRKIELRIMYGDTTSTLSNMKHLIDDEQVFAIVSGITAGSEQGIAALSKDREVPFIGPSALLPQRDLPVNRYVFYLLPGLKEQARTLVNFAARKTDPKKSRVAIICPDSDFSRGIAKSIEDQANKLGWTTITRVYYQPDKFNSARYVDQLKQQGIDTVFHLGSGADTGALFKDAQSAGWSPAVYLLGTLVGRNITELVPVKMKDQVFLAFPTIPADISPAGAAEYNGLLQKNKLISTHAAAQASAIAAARILVQGLELSGKDLSRERLVTTLEGLYEFETGLMPRITFGPNRRIGVLGAYIITIDPEKKLFPASAEWIPVD
ncbi:MAG TPA: ABC transporter substrate-binding protein [Pyrinomonadaceae bacterium]|nr:ABC transporter substrate-binding protein [Pyrinomonadaceae bacterium]